MGSFEWISELNILWGMDTIQDWGPPQFTNGIEDNVLLADDVEQWALEHNVHFSGDPEW